jgi:hypothetical protein
MKNLVEDFTNNICTCVLYTESFGEDFKSFSKTRNNKLPMIAIFWYIRVITKLPNSEQSYKGKVKTHNYINRQNQSTTGKL